MTYHAVPSRIVSRRDMRRNPLPEPVEHYQHKTVFVKPTTRKPMFPEENMTVVVRNHDDHVVAKHDDWYKAMLDAKDRAHADSRVYRLETPYKVWLIGDEGVTVHDRKKNPAAPASMRQLDDAFEILGLTGEFGKLSEIDDIDALREIEDRIDYASSEEPDFQRALALVKSYLRRTIEESDEEVLGRASREGMVELLDLEDDEDPEIMTIYEKMLTDEELTDYEKMLLDAHMGGLSEDPDDSPSRKRNPILVSRDDRLSNPVETAAGAKLSELRSMPLPQGVTMSTTPQLVQALYLLGYPKPVSHATEINVRGLAAIVIFLRDLLKDSRPSEDVRTRLAVSTLALAEGDLRAASLALVTKQRPSSLGPAAHAAAEQRVLFSRTALRSSTSLGQSASSKGASRPTQQMLMQLLQTREGNPLPVSRIDDSWDKIEETLLQKDLLGDRIEASADVKQAIKVLAPSIPRDSALALWARPGYQDQDFSSWMQALDEIYALLAFSRRSSTALGSAAQASALATLLTALAGRFEGVIRVAYFAKLSGITEPEPLDLVIAEASSPPETVARPPSFGPTKVSRQGNPLAKSLEDLPDVDLSEGRLSNPCGCGDRMPWTDDPRDQNPLTSAEDSLASLPDVDLSDPAPARGSAWSRGSSRGRQGNPFDKEEAEAREDAAALRLPPDHILVVMIGKNDPKLMHEALEAIDAMRPVVGHGKKHLLEHLERYALSRGGYRHGEAKPSAAPGTSTKDNPLHGSHLLQPTMNRRWRERTISVPSAIVQVLIQIRDPAGTSTPKTDQLISSAHEGAVSLSQIDVAVVELREQKKKYKPRTGLRKLFDAAEKDLLLLRANAHQYQTASLGYDAAHHGMENESLVVLP